MAKLRQFPGKGADALGDGVARDEAELGAAVAEDVLPIGVELGLIHRNPDGAEREGGVGANGPFEAVVADDGDAIPARDAALRQAGAALADEAAELGVGGPGPAVGAAGAEGGTVAVFGDDFLEHGGEVGEARLECHGGVVYRTSRGIVLALSGAAGAAAWLAARAAIALALAAAPTARWRPMRWFQAALAAGALVLAAGACGSSITVPDQGIILTGCTTPAACYTTNCGCSRARLADCVVQAMCDDQNDKSTCRCPEGSQCLEVAQACVGKGPVCTGFGALCVPPGTACSPNTGNPPMLVPSDMGTVSLESRCQFADDTCCPGSATTD
jgi:hypothetical protein